jgi:hypothetical protein
MSFRQFHEPTKGIAQNHAINTPELHNESKTCFSKSVYEEKMFEAKKHTNAYC